MIIGFMFCLNFLLNNGGQSGSASGFDQEIHDILIGPSNPLGIKPKSQFDYGVLPAVIKYNDAYVLKGMLIGTRV